MFLSIWNYLNNLEMAKLFPAAFRDNANLARGSKNLFLLMLKYTLFTPGSNYSFGQKIPFAFFFFFKAWTCTSNSASQVYSIFNSALRKAHLRLVLKCECVVSDPSPGNVRGLFLGSGWWRPVCKTRPAKQSCSHLLHTTDRWVSLLYLFFMLYLRRIWFSGGCWSAPLLWFKYIPQLDFTPMAQPRRLWRYYPSFSQVLFGSNWLPWKLENDTKVEMKSWCASVVIMQENVRWSTIEHSSQVLKYEKLIFCPLEW